MRAYNFDNIPGDQRLPHDTNSTPISVDELKKLNVLYWEIPIDGNEITKIDAVAKERGYKNRDEINVSKAGLGDLYETKIKTFFEEHMHEDEEIRFILEGSGFFDVRDASSDQWIRIHVEQGDLLVVPAGIYHRFTLDTNDKIRAMRLFQDEPKWVPHNRSEETDKNFHRVEYLKSVSAAA